MNDDPIVSIILPTKNRPQLLKKAISSILTQNYNNWELIIIDSSDDDLSKKIILSFQDKRIKYHYYKKETFNGIWEYLNYGINNSNGKYIARLDDDDTYCNKNAISMQVDFLESNPDYILTGGGINMVDLNGQILFSVCRNESDDKIRKSILSSCPFEHPTIVFRKEKNEQLNYYDNYPVCEDWEFFLRMGTKGKLYNFQEIFTNYLQWENNLYLINPRLIAKTELGLIWKYRKYYPGYLKGYLLHLIQYLYSFLPVFIISVLRYRVRYIKRKYF